MTTKYSDFIKMQNFLPVYDMTDETPEMWKTFIPTKQFCDLLKRSITAITSNDISKRRSMWVRGTFGTGKSHASSVVRHLLCDEADKIEDYVKNISDEALRAELTALRKQKRYFPVVLKGVESAYDIPHFTLSLQRETKRAIIQAGHNPQVVKSDFDSAIDWVEGHKNRIGELLANNEELASDARNAEELLALLKAEDIDVFVHLEKSLLSDSTYIVCKNISDWLAEIAEKLKEEDIAEGLIIFWDEFTSVMETLKNDRINLLQNIAEKSKSNNVFLYLISHRTDSAYSDTKLKDISKMGDRYDVLDYMMDQISTYLILRHTFTISDDYQKQLLFDNITKSIDDNLYGYLCESGNLEEREHIKNLLPLHPYTAFLCSRMANIMGSANRSVLKFMNDEQHGFRQFIDNSNNFEQKMMLTADWLWDFFYSTFVNEPLCGVFINLYSTQKTRVENQGEDYLRVFKVILLLNALTVKFQNSLEKYSPNEVNIKYIFTGDRCYDNIDEILNWFDTNQIVSRDIFGEFKISVASYNPIELKNAKDAVQRDFPTAIHYLKYNIMCQQEIQKLFLVGERLMRKCEPQLYACEEQMPLLQNKLSKYTTEKPNFLHVALFFSITEESRDNMENMAKSLSETFPNTIFIVPAEVFTNDSKTHFIDAVAQAKVGRAHFNNDEASQMENTAREYVAKWKSRISGGSFSLYFNGEYNSDGIFANIFQIINKKYSAMLFPVGMESVKALQSVPMTFFANKNFKSLSLQMLQKRTRDEMLSFTGSSIPAKQIFIEGENNLVDDACVLTAAAKAGNSWLKEVCNKVDSLIEIAKKKYQERFNLSEILLPLMRQPYGLFSNQANYAVLGYALRKHKEDLFNPSTSQPVGDEKLNDMIEILLKMWDNGTNEVNNKLFLRFGSAEERNLTSILGEVFNLGAVSGVNMADLKSLTYAKWGITEFCKQKAQYPLWTLLYCDKIKGKDNCKKVIENLISLFNQDTYQLAKIKSLYSEIKNSQVELYILLTNQGNYKEGFENYINSIENVNIKQEWWNELMDELSHLQSEIAFRKEEDVKTCVMGFYINKIQPAPQPILQSPQAVPSSVTQSDIISGQCDTKETEAKVAKAKVAVKEKVMSNMMWQKVMLDMLEKHPEVSQFVIDYLGD